MEFAQEEDLGQPGQAFGADQGLAPAPGLQLFLADVGAAVFATVWSHRRRHLAAHDEAVALQRTERGVEPGQFGGPEVLERGAELAAQIVTARRLIQEAEEDVPQAHPAAARCGSSPNRRW